MRVVGTRAAVESRFGHAVGLILTSLVLVGCGGESRQYGKPGSGGSPSSGTGAGGAVVAVDLTANVIRRPSVDKLDLLLMIDNSADMADKQALLADAIPRLVQGMSGAGVQSLHVGVITSSIGGHGAELCSGNGATLNDEEENDHSWLIAKRPRFSPPAGGLPLEPQGFLNWAPGASTTDVATSFRAMVTATGELGCGFESQLESVYRFLVDPHPSKTVTTAKCPDPDETCAIPAGIDTDLLTQRAAFLRPDSAVVVVMLTDENDCSIQESGPLYEAMRTDIVLPHGAAVCASAPNDPCCYSCADAPPSGCAPDPSCATLGNADDDPVNLRCFHEKQRFGKEYVYPTARYVNAFTKSQICTSNPDLSVDPTCPDLDADGKPDLAPNPLFTAAAGAAVRTSSLVYLAGIVGVPWQDIAANADVHGAPYPAGELHFTRPLHLNWNAILGDDGTPSAGPRAPTDALMTESIDPRSGSDGESPSKALAAPDAGYLANPVNGHEQKQGVSEDLQYACIFPLATPRTCSRTPMASGPACDCAGFDDGSMNPLCQAPDGSFSATQSFAKAYPAVRELEVLKGLGDSAIVASICPRNTMDATKQDYGYAPAVDTILERVGEALTPSCLPSALPVVADPTTGKVAVACHLVEARPGTAADCSQTKGRSTPEPAVLAAAQAALMTAGACGVMGKPSCDSYFVCQIDEAGDGCHEDPSTTETGWCYIDPATNTADNAALVARCPATMRRNLRFVDPAGATPAPDATLLLVCPK